MLRFSYKNMIIYDFGQKIKDFCQFIEFLRKYKSDNLISGEGKR